MAMKPQVVAAKGADTTIIVGHGLTIPQSVEIGPNVFVEAGYPDLHVTDLDAGCDTDLERFAIATMHDMTTFSLRVVEAEGGKALANKAWNSLWDFHLLSVCCGSPSYFLYSVSPGNSAAYSVANRNLIVNPLPKVAPVTLEQLLWAKANREHFHALIKDERFASAMRYFGNAHYLFDLDARIMLLWAGIEGMLDADAEQSRRVALYAGLMFDGDSVAKAAHAERARKAYHLRSRVVHGKKPPADKLQEGYETASEILIRLLAKCVCLRRVPARGELDALATSPTLK